jgi:hypothetical protein
MATHKITFTEAEEFFYQHAPYSWDPERETQASGRARCAMELAAAESRLQAEFPEIEVVWEEDDAEWDGDCPAPKYVLQATLYRRAQREDSSDRDDVLASCGGIGLNDLDSPYRRVMEAELALEALTL